MVEKSYIVKKKKLFRRREIFAQAFLTKSVDNT